jgi:hypothetical protein
MMVRVPYVTKSGERRVYEYAPPERNEALKACQRTLRRQKTMHLVGKARWRSGGPRSRSFQNITMFQLIASGEATRQGNVVTARVGEGET